jgi:hypothetical protein
MGVPETGIVDATNCAAAVERVGFPSMLKPDCKPACGVGFKAIQIDSASVNSTTPAPVAHSLLSMTSAAEPAFSRSTPDSAPIARPWCPTAWICRWHSSRCCTEYRRRRIVLASDDAMRGSTATSRDWRMRYARVGNRHELADGSGARSCRSGARTITSPGTERTRCRPF